MEAFRSCAKSGGIGQRRFFSPNWLHLLCDLLILPSDYSYSKKKKKSPQTSLGLQELVPPRKLRSYVICGNGMADFSCEMPVDKTAGDAIIFLLLINPFFYRPFVGSTNTKDKTRGRKSSFTLQTLRHISLSESTMPSVPRFNKDCVSIFINPTMLRYICTYQRIFYVHDITSDQEVEHICMCEKTH
uniref:5-oxoprolinase n=1 Tax=Anthurium amnicola TaxID=1678845 RepID=A0A1D1XE07_9ARAE